MFRILIFCCSEDGKGSNVAFLFFDLIYCGCFLDGRLREIPLLYLSTYVYDLFCDRMGSCQSL